MASSLKRLKKLSMHVCGDSGPFDEFNPSFVARQKLGLELLYVLNIKPMNVADACSALKTGRKRVTELLNGWAKINAVREESGVYYVNFAIFTKEDLMVLARASEKIARELANSINNHADKIVSLAKNFSAATQVQTGKLLFAAVGCFILDWLGLDTLEEEKLIIKSKPQPGNRKYILFAREEVDQKTALQLYDQMYWGSHSDESDGYIFTSFGDHCGMRYAFPDVLWTLQASPKAVQEQFKPPSWVTEKLSVIIQLCSKRMLRDTADLLFRLNAEKEISAEKGEINGELWTSLAHLLEDMNYVVREKGRVMLNYPVFVEDDKKIVEQIADITRPLIVQIMRKNYSQLQKALSNTTPVRNRVAWNEILNEAWHWIFAKTNRVLAESGFLYNPTKRREREARHIAWVSKFNFP